MKRTERGNTPTEKRRAVALHFPSAFALSLSKGAEASTGPERMDVADYSAATPQDEFTRSDCASVATPAPIDTRRPRNG